VTLDDGSVVRGLAVVDATGFRRRFVEHGVAFDPGFQVTYGALLEVEAHPFDLDKLVLMDYRDACGAGDVEAARRNERFPSFMYVMPLSATEIFFEETILVSRPGGDSRDLEARLRERLRRAYGIEDFRVLESERAAIPMGGADPTVPQRTVGCGSTASCIHPASGYMVARALEVAPLFAAALAAHPRFSEAGRRAAAESGVEADLDGIAEVGWAAVWPPDDRRQRDFMHFGFELLCDLSPGELRDFFAGFFRLPDALWEHFLSWRLSGAGHVWMGGLVWWSCIPKRFMAPMLVKSLPYLLDRLLLPFASRGGPLRAPHTPYTAPRWRPGPYYAYLEALRGSLAAGEPLPAGGDDDDDVS
jgi:lycopene cyclase-like protein